MSKPDQTDEPKLLPCPFCGGAMQYRKALWPSDGCTDAVIHANPSECGMVDFSIGTTDDGVIAAWNRRAVPALVQPEPFIAALRAYADNEYCLGIRMAGWHDECLGWEHKLKVGKFGRAEMEAHEKMNKHLGAHFGIHEAIKSALAASPSASQPEPSLYRQSNGPAMVSEALRTIGDIASASLTPPAPEASDAKAMAESFARYCELLYAVHRKFPGESRHETALRYIREAEASASDSQASANADRT